MSSNLSRISGASGSLPSLSQSEQGDGSLPSALSLQAIREARLAYFSAQGGSSYTSASLEGTTSSSAAFNASFVRTESDDLSALSPEEITDRNICESYKKSVCSRINRLNPSYNAKLQQMFKVTGDSPLHSGSELIKRLKDTIPSSSVSSSSSSTAASDTPSGCLDDMPSVDSELEVLLPSDQEEFFQLILDKGKDFSYIEEKNVFQIIDCALFLGYDDLLKACDGFLRDKIIEDPEPRDFWARVQKLAYLPCARSKIRAFQGFLIEDYINNGNKGSLSALLERFQSMQISFDLRKINIKNPSADTSIILKVLDLNPQIESLSLPGDCISVSLMKALQNCKNFRSLEILRSGIAMSLEQQSAFLSGIAMPLEQQSALLYGLENIKSIESLFVNGNYLGDDFIEKVVRVCPDLRTFSLLGSSASSELVTERSIRNLAKLKKLTHLKLNTNIQNADCFKVGFENLEYLELHGYINKISLLKVMSHMKQVKTLMFNTSIKHELIRTPELARYLNDYDWIQELCFAENYYDFEGVKARLISLLTRPLKVWRVINL